MQTVTSILELRNIVKQWQQKGQKIAFVPTMGNIHDGHIKLVKTAQKLADRVIVSIFVNPTQFGIGEDFQSYPRTEREDEVKLSAIASDLLFIPTLEEIYHENANTVVSVVELSKHHCGATRPGHFEGVATIVTKLFNIVRPDIAVFGEKDFQQLIVIKNMVRDLDIPIEIVGVPTAREADGLAMSSRNNHLTQQQRIIAPKLYQALTKAHETVLQKNKNFRAIEQQQHEYLNNKGFKVDYFSICRSIDLQAATEKDRELVILVAAKLGKPRLIDNLCFTR